MASILDQYEYAQTAVSSPSSRTIQEPVRNYVYMPLLYTAILHGFLHDNFQMKIKYFLLFLLKT